MKKSLSKVDEGETERIKRRWLPLKHGRKKTFHKETKINNEGKTIIEDRSSWKVGRGSTPDDGIFKEGVVDQIGSVEICDTGWGQKKVTPEECEQRIEKLETDVGRIYKDVTISKNILNLMDQYINKNFYDNLTVV